MSIRNIKHDPDDTFVSDREDENSHTIVFEANDGNTYVLTKRYLGGGGFGSVFVGYKVKVENGMYKVKPSSPRYAIKQILHMEEDDDGDFKVFKLMKSYVKCHVNIACFYGWAFQGDTCYIVMEYVDGGNLREYALKMDKDRVPLSEKIDRLYPIFLEMLRGISHISSLGIIHYDIKPENVIVTKNSIKYVDFGLSCYKASFDQFKSFLHVDNDEIETCDRRYTSGTSGYIDPVLYHRINDDKLNNDIYSLGATFFRVITGKRPYDFSDIPHEKWTTKHAELMAMLEPLKDQSDKMEKVRILVTKMMNLDFTKRPTIQSSILFLKGEEELKYENDGIDEAVRQFNILNRKHNLDDTDNQATIELLHHIARFPKLLSRLVPPTNNEVVAPRVKKYVEHLQTKTQKALDETTDNQKKTEYNEILDTIRNLRVLRLIDAK
jgi:serine/threonine protein kinase